MKLTAGIFNWNGYGQNAAETAEKVGLCEVVNSCVVINSDPNDEREGWVNIGDRYYGGQFAAMLDQWEFGTGLLLIQVDTQSEWWKTIPNCLELLKIGHGIAAPNCSNIYWDRRFILGWNNAKVARVLHTDCCVWMLHPEVVSTLREYKEVIDQNEFGWDVDILANAIARLQGRYIVRDYRLSAHHVEGTNYDKAKAKEIGGRFLEKLDLKVRNEIQEIRRVQYRICNET